MDNVWVKCINCGKRYVRPAKRVNEAEKHSWKQYCSSECLSQYRNKQQEIACETCGKRFLGQPSEISLRNFCSHSCSAKHSNRARKKKVKICPTCKKEYSGKSKYCSIICIPKRVSSYTKNRLNVVLKNLL